MTTLEYSTEHPTLLILEYGRHIQKMIGGTALLGDRNMRNRTTRSVVVVMGNLFPHLCDVPDFQHKLWDRLFIISDFKLGAGSPYEEPTRSTLYKRPDRLWYPQAHPKYRFYGNVIIRMIETCCKRERGELREALEYSVANHMEKSFLTWNKEPVNDSVVFEHLYELSGGKIDLRHRREDLTDNQSPIRTEVNLAKRIPTTPPYYGQGQQKKRFINYKKNNNGRFQDWRKAYS